MFSYKPCAFDFLGKWGSGEVGKWGSGEVGRINKTNLLSPDN
ncbi:hypothetical protein [Microcystis aeruginosa]|nr:hypothetical protein [Microcystis aeruginosa]